VVCPRADWQAIAVDPFNAITVKSVALSRFGAVDFIFV
jgi:hypothetical protein